MFILIFKFYMLLNYHYISKKNYKKFTYNNQYSLRYKNIKKRNSFMIRIIIDNIYK